MNNILTNTLNKYNMNIPLVNNLCSELMSKYFPLVTKQRTVDDMLNNIMSLPCKTSLKYLVVKQLRVLKHTEASVLDQRNEVLYNLLRAVHENKTLCDLSINKLRCAIVLLKRCEYTATLSIINQVLSSVPPYALYKSASEYSESKRLYVDMFLNSSCTVMERAKKAWIPDLIFNRQMTEILPLAIQIEVNYNTDIDLLRKYLVIYLSPFTCAYYLMFLCYHELGQYDNRDRALQQLIEVVNNPEQCGKEPYRSYNIAGHCLLVTGERERARDMFNRSIQFSRRDSWWDRRNTAEWYIRNFCV